jgi:peptidoglycan/LPS O-acetylase OafA/YrhL
MRIASPRTVAAAALVLLFHLWLLIVGATRNIREFPIINQGKVGGQLFMVISGFIRLSSPSSASTRN